MLFDNLTRIIPAGSILLTSYKTRLKPVTDASDNLMNQLSYYSRGFESAAV